MTNIAKDLRQRLDEEFVIGRPEIVTEQVSNDGTRKWLLRFPPDERGARHEVEMVYIPEEDRGTLCISTPGRLHADLHLLPHRHAEAGAQPDAGEIVGQVMLARDRREGLAAATSRRNPTPPLERALHHQHRDDGHGRAALQFRQRARTRWRSSSDGEGIVAVEAPHHAVDLRRRAGDGPRRRRDRRHAGDLAACASRTRSATSSCRSTRNIRSRNCCDACRAYPGAIECAAHHLRICDAEGRERQRGGRASGWCSCCKAFRPRST